MCRDEAPANSIILLPFAWVTRCGTRRGTPQLVSCTTVASQEIEERVLWTTVSNNVLSCFFAFAFVMCLFFTFHAAALYCCAPRPLRLSPVAFHFFYLYHWRKMSNAKHSFASFSLFFGWHICWLRHNLFLLEFCCSRV